MLGPGGHLGRFAAYAATPLVILLIEALRYNDVYVIVPFLAIYSTIAVVAAASGLRAGFVSAFFAGLYTIYAALMDYGPDTLTGGPVQVLAGLAVAGTIAYVLGRMKDQSMHLIAEIGQTRDQLRERTESLEAQVADRTADYVRMTARVLHIQETERANLSRELHDEFGQLLVALKLALRQLKSTPEAAETLRDAEELLDRLVQQTHSLSLLLQPVLLDPAGVVASIRRFVEQQAIRAGFEYRLDMEPLPDDLDKSTLLMVFRCVQEAMTNIVKYADARHVSVSLHIDGGVLRIVIEDDGRGFDVPERWRVSENGGLGIPGMLERFRAAGGELSVTSSRGRGTRVVGCVPLASDGDEDRIGRQAVG